MAILKAVERLVTCLANSLDKVANIDAGGERFAQRAATALRESCLSVNPTPTPSAGPCSGWNELIEMARRQSDPDLVNALFALEPCIPWIPGNHYWPEKKYDYFTTTMRGGLVIGDDGAAFNCEGGYIVLLHTMHAHSVYPLHKHRIPEGYFIVGGHCEWSHDGKNWSTYIPGTLFYNQSWEPHAIRSKDEPLLSLDIYLPPFGWEGGLVDEAKS